MIPQLEGEAPTPELVDKLGCETVARADLDPKQRGRALKVGGKWPPTAMYNKGRLGKRQYAAACELRKLHDLGFRAPIKGTHYGDRVQAGARPAAPLDRMLDAAARYRRALAFAANGDPKK
jgi:hypothetical protein